MVDFAKALLASDYYPLLVPAAWCVGCLFGRCVRLAWLWFMAKE